MSAGHAGAPLRAGVMIPRKRVFVPTVPQSIVHLSKGDQAETLHATGQSEVPHVSCWSNTGHAFPPLVAAVITNRERVVTPEPQDLVHGAQAAHKDTSQLIEHSSVLQVCVSLSEGQSCPLQADDLVTTLSLAREPVAHALVHKPH